jgi:hypothetical protein
MTKKTYDFAHFHMMLTECMTRMNSKHADDDPLDLPQALLDTPYGIFRYISSCAQFQMELLHQQLNQDLQIEPEIHEKLSSLFERVLNLLNASTDCEIL